MVRHDRGAHELVQLDGSWARIFVRSAQSGITVLGPIDRGRGPSTGLTLGAMDMEAVLTLFSFAGFAALLVSWIMAPMRADVPTNLPVAEAVQPNAAIAA